MERRSIEERLARRAGALEPSPIRVLFPLMSLEGMISLGGGYPNARTFPLGTLEATLKGSGGLKLEGAELDAASQYGPSDVHPALREPLKEWHRTKDGVGIVDGGVVTLNGAQEGLFIMAYLFLDEEDSVVVSEPTYPGALAAFRTFTQRFVSIPLDEKGMDTDALEKRLEEIAAAGERLPKFIYTIPNGHNPGGVSLAPERRERMIAIARRFDILILDDDPYQMIRLDKNNESPTTLQSLDQEGLVVRLDSFSKIFAPGLRIGYASGDPAIIERFVLFKQAANLHTSSLTQVLLARCLEETGARGFMDRIEENCLFYRKNRDVMVESAGEFLPEGIDFNTPEAGFFVWFRMPDRCSAESMVRLDSRELGVLLVPGSGFSATGKLDNCMRASFATATPENICEGMRRFGVMVHREFERKGI
jgi:DNA-binding transcriptional MocR family regulator